MKEKKKIEELAKELYEHRHDPGEWSEEAIPVEVRPAKTAVISCRLPLEDFHALVEAMTSKDESLSEYVRKAVALRLQNDALSGANTTISYSTPNEQNKWRYFDTTPAPQFVDRLRELRAASE